MRLIVGLGNVGEKYKNNRHNVGFLVVDTLVSQISNEVQNSEFIYQKKFKSLVFSFQSSVIFAKPQTMMNSSGEAVSALVNFYKIKLDNLWVIHDDLDIILGDYKIQKAKGPRDHNGLTSIYKKLGKKDFWHVRVGIENRKKKFSIFNSPFGWAGFQFSKRISGKEYVLQNFDAREKEIIKTTIDKIARDLISKPAD